MLRMQKAFKGIAAKGFIFRKSVKRMTLKWFSQSENVRDITKKASLYPEAVPCTSRLIKFDHWSGIRLLSQAISLDKVK
jgi:hypothetical protein